MATLNGETAFERGVNDGRSDSRAGLTYMPGSSEYERGYQEGYHQMCQLALGRPLYPWSYQQNYATHLMLGEFKKA